VRFMDRRACGVNASSIWAPHETRQRTSDFKQRCEALADRASMATSSFNWHGCHPDYRVLEVRPRDAHGESLIELHIYANPETGESLAWWEIYDGEWFFCAKTGQASTRGASRSYTEAVRA
jgi:hypothetical protein